MLVACQFQGSLTLQYEKVLFLLRPSNLTRSLARRRVTVHDFPDGRFEVRHQGLALPYLVFDKGRQVQHGGVVAHKNLGTAMTAIKAKQARHGNMITASLTPAVGTPPPDRLGLCANAARASGKEARHRDAPSKSCSRIQ